jgi:ParB-like chromosome segregation protein Spo0J
MAKLRMERSHTSLIPVTSLAHGDSPRLSGEVREHTRQLASLETALPPILVHRATMRVIDGIHRLRAALLRGDETIEVEYFDGDEAEAFLVAVRKNTEHGLPLTRADRAAATARIVASHPNYSDRSIAAITGVATKTVAAVRRHIALGDRNLTRIGRDGRVRPLSSAAARRLASEVISKHPEASLRDVAQATGLSPTTVRDVRERIRRGDDPVPPRQRDGDRQSALAHIDHGKSVPDGRSVFDAQVRDQAERTEARDRTALLLGNLSRDPSLRFSESGRTVLKWLLARAAGPAGWERMIEAIPSHCAYLVADVARGCAEEWSAFADRLEKRLRNTA